MGNEQASNSDIQSQLNLLEFQVQQIVKNTSGIPDVLKELAVHRTEFENYRDQMQARISNIDESRNELQTSIANVANRIEARCDERVAGVEHTISGISDKVAMQQRWIWTCIGGAGIVSGLLITATSMVNDGVRALIEANKQSALLEYRVKKIEEFAALGEHK